MKLAEIDENMKVTADRDFLKLDLYDPLEGGFAVLGLEKVESRRAYRKFSEQDMAAIEKINAGAHWAAGCTAGAQIHFKTDSRLVSVYAKLAGPPTMDNMAPLGSAGIDAYVYDEAAKDYLFCGITRLDTARDEYCCRVVDMEERAEREVILNLPLYNGVKKLVIGLERGASLTPSYAFRERGRIVFYGTSIVQGASASRPGLCHTNRVSRALRTECLNFGFSGSALGEADIVRRIAATENASAFVVDYEQNAGFSGTLRSTLDGVIEAIRAAYPTAPIVVASAAPYAACAYSAKYRAAESGWRKFQQDTVERLRAAGDARVFFLDGSELFGKRFTEYTIDGVHPTDEGFALLTEAFVRRLRKLGL